MPNYQHGKIYKLITDLNPELVYIGSTCQALSSRKSAHKGMYKRFLAGKGGFMTSYKIFDVDPNPIIVLLEACPCNSKEELHARERHWIENTACVNRNIPGRTQQAYREANKEKLREDARAYRRANKEKVRERERAYRRANKERLKAKGKLWRDKNKEKVRAYYLAHREKDNERKRDHYQANKEMILARKKLWRDNHKEEAREKGRAYRRANKDRENAKVTCDCGSTVYRRMLRRHERTKKHQTWRAEQ